MFDRIIRVVEFTLVYIIFAALFSYSNPSLTDQIEKIRAYTRQLEFNYITWTWDAALVKAQAASVGAPDAFDHETQQQLVAEYMRVTQLSMEYEHALETIYADAGITDKQTASSDIRAKLDEVLARQQDIAPLAEAVLQGQVAEVLADLGLTALGQPVPNVLYHSTPLPFALIVSPRDRIEQVANVSVNTDLSVDQQAMLEERVDEGLNTSSLVVPIGGVGVYPTMVMRTTDLRWLLNTIAHEWTHNYLTLRPLGFLYTNSPELRTMNETTASIAGDEIGAQVLERFYPQLMASTEHSAGLIALPVGSSQSDDPPFDFRAEMHETRITVDEMLAEGHIEEAEAYMEERRLIFMENGYLLRKINQAYFAFYGAYADVPGGAAGEDPVGPAVRALRAQSDSLADFINTISWMTSFEDLQEALGD